MFYDCKHCFCKCETAVLKVETTTTSVQQGENVVIKISMSSNTTKNIAAIGFNVDVPDSFEYVSHTLASGLPENAVYTNRTGTFGCYNGQLSGDFEIVTITYKVKEAADAGEASVGIKNDDDLSVTDVDDGLVDLTINPCTLTITTPMFTSGLPSGPAMIPTTGMSVRPKAAP